VLESSRCISWEVVLVNFNQKKRLELNEAIGNDKIRNWLIVLVESCLKCCTEVSLLVKHNVDINLESMYSSYVMELSILEYHIKYETILQDVNFILLFAFIF